MTAPTTENDAPCGCRADLGEVCPRCPLTGSVDRTPGVPTATIPRPTPGSVAAELALLRADHRRQVLDIHTALDKCGAPLGGTPAERIGRLAADRDIERVRCSRLAGVTDDLQRNLAAAQARAHEADEDAAAFEGDLAALRLGLSRILGVEEGYMNDEDLLTTVTLLTKRKPSPSLPHILALFDARAVGDPVLTAMVGILRGAL